MTKQRHASDRLADGAPFPLWEPARFTFSRTWWVDGAHTDADDAGPGGEDRPLRTIGAAAERVRPGERVLIRSGLYRERVAPRRGGTGPARLISYEATPGATVVITGAEPFAPDWQPAPGHPKVWRASLDALPVEATNPFLCDNVTPAQFDAMEWAWPLRGKAPYTWGRGLVFQNGARLEQRGAAADLTERPGLFYVDRAARQIHLRPLADANPHTQHFELTARETVFAPRACGLGYIRVKGLTLRCAGNPFPFPQLGVLSTRAGHHWIIEDCAIAWANGVGLDIGAQVTEAAWGREGAPVGVTVTPRAATRVGRHIVRRNLVSDCGICGIAGLGPRRGRGFGVLIEQNVVERCAFHDVERLFETGGIKTHRNRDCLIRDNRIADVAHGPGLWLDWNNANTRATRNVITGCACGSGAVFVEGSYRPNLVDHNIIVANRSSGIYDHDCHRQVYAHNLIAGNTGHPVHVYGKCTDRRIDGVVIRYGADTVINNVFGRDDRACVFRNEPSHVAGNARAAVTATVAETAVTVAIADELARVAADPPPPSVAAALDRDFTGARRARRTNQPGPFVGTPAAPATVWPR